VPLAAKPLGNDDRQAATTCNQADRRGRRRRVGQNS